MAQIAPLVTQTLRRRPTQLNGSLGIHGLLSLQATCIVNTRDGRSWSRYVCPSQGLTPLGFVANSQPKSFNDGHQF
jgi:hypothetical protein